MKKRLVTIAILVVLAAIGYFGYRLIQSRQQADTISSLQTIRVSKGSLTATVGATGIVRPDQTGMIAWQTSGIVDQVYVQVGQAVTAGEILADLTDSSLPQISFLPRQTWSPPEMPSPG